MITKKYYKLIRVSHADEGYFYIKNVSNEVGEFKIKNYTSGTMEYSLDGVTWTSYNLSTKPSVSVNPGSNIYLRGTGFKDDSEYDVLDFNKDYNVGGNFMSLSNYSTMSSVSSISSTNIIKTALANQTHLISAQDLNFGNVNSVGDYCLAGIFRYCTALTTTPDFSNITSVGEYGFASTFEGTTSLTSGPDFSNITVAGSGCFAACFGGYTHISNVTTPNIQDLTQNSVLNNWLYNNAGTQATGTKVVNVPTGATITTDSPSGIPTGWTRVDY